MSQPKHQGAFVTSISHTAKLQGVFVNLAKCARQKQNFSQEEYMMVNDGMKGKPRDKNLQ